jgi:hypothetical protein
VSGVDHWVGAEGQLRLVGRSALVPYVPPIEPATVDPGLAFELAPLLAALAAALRMVLPHWFVTDPLGGDGAATTANPGGGANSATYYRDRMPGGSITASDGDWDYRDEPYDPFPRPRASTSSWSWQVLDQAWEIQQAYAAGITGTFVDWLNLNDGPTSAGVATDNRLGQVRQLMDGVIAAGLVGKFGVAPMIDGNTSIARNTNQAAMIVALASLLNHPASLKDPVTGKPVVGVYMPEGSVLSTHDATPTQVHDWLAAIKAGLLTDHGIDIRKVRASHQRGAASPTGDSRPGWAGVQPGQGYYDALPDVAEPGRWSSRNPDEALNPNTQNAGAIAYAQSHYPGSRWLASVAPQDERPNQNKYEEARGFENFLAMWQVAIENGASDVQLTTWSDFKEHAHIMPSRNHGWTWLDLTAYYKARFQLGYWPTVTRDTIYGAHRVMLTTATPTNTSIPRQIKAGSTAAANIVSCLAFLRDTTDVTVNITVGGVTTPFTPGPATKAYGGNGVYIFNAPLRPGSVSMEIVRGGHTVQQVTSPFTVTATPVVDDLHYRAFSSRRGMDGVPR